MKNDSNAVKVALIPKAYPNRLLELKMKEKKKNEDIRQNFIAK